MRAMSIAIQIRLLDRRDEPRALDGPSERRV
jgi:hypothetical protein